MITDKQIQKAIRQAPGRGKAIELRDPGPRGSGRLTMAVRPFPGGRVASEWYVVYYRGGRRCMAKLGSYPRDDDRGGQGDIRLGLCDRDLRRARARDNGETPRPEERDRQGTVRGLCGSPPAGWQASGRHGPQHALGQGDWRGGRHRRQSSGVIHRAGRYRSTPCGDPRQGREDTSERSAGVHFRRLCLRYEG